MTDPFFDTNIVIDWLVNRPEAVRELSLYSYHRISRVAWTEVLAGESSDRRNLVVSLLTAFEIVEVDDRIARAAAEVRHRSRMKLVDAFIFATAQVSGSILITRNTRDFPPTMPGVRVPYTL